jgi:hypothetical protein
VASHRRSARPNANAGNTWRYGNQDYADTDHAMLRYASCCFPYASPVLELGAGKQELASEGHFKHLISLSKSGAGEGIRTLDPNLGKVIIGLR